MPEPFVLRPRTTSGLAVEDVPAPKAVNAAFGALAEHVRDPLVTDIFVNGSAGLFVDRGEGAERVADWRASERRKTVIEVEAGRVAAKISTLHGIAHALGVPLPQLVEPVCARHPRSVTTPSGVV